MGYINRAMKSVGHHGGKAPRRLYVQVLVLSASEIPSVGGRGGGGGEQRVTDQALIRTLSAHHQRVQCWARHG